MKQLLHACVFLFAIFSVITEGSEGYTPAGEWGTPIMPVETPESRAQEQRLRDIMNAAMGLQVSSRTVALNDSVILTWNNISHVDRYEFWQSINGKESTRDVHQSRLSIKHTVGGEYRYSVRGCLGGVCSGWSETITVNSPAWSKDDWNAYLASPPTDFSLSEQILSADFAEIRFDWDAKQPYATETVAYEIEQLARHYNGASWHRIYRDRNNHHTIRMKPDESYDFRVRVCYFHGDINGTALGCTDWAEPISYLFDPSILEDIEEPIPAPSAVTGLAVDHERITVGESFTLSWTASNGPVTHYEVVIKTVGSSDWTLVYSGSDPHIRTGNKLPAETVHDYKVRACNDTGCSPYSDPVRVGVKSLPVVIPAVSGLSVNQASVKQDESFVLNWDRLDLASSFEVLEQFQGAEKVIYSGPRSSGGKSLVRSHIGTYTYRVRGCRTVSHETVCGDYSSAVTVTITEKILPPPPVQGISASTARAIVGRGFTLSWRAITEGPVDRYEVYQTQNAAGKTTVYSGSGTSVTLGQDLAADNRYVYVVVACNSAGCSQESNGVAVDIEPIPVPGIVQDVRISAQEIKEGETFRVSWEWLKEDDVTRYEVLQSSDSQQETVYSGTASSVVLGEDLEGGNTYYYKVRACNSIGCGEYSDRVSVNILSPEEVPPEVLPPTEEVLGTIDDSPLDSVNAFQLAGHTSNVGALNSSSLVNPDGSFSYKVDILTPEGRLGLTPDVSLNYNSNNGNGFLGVGWGLSGLSKIHRCGKLYATDGIQTGIAMDNTDPICLDGQQLVLISGSHRSAGAVYQPLTFNGSRVYVKGSGFQLKTVEGRILNFGETEASRKDNFSWLLSSIEDRHGNRVNYEYSDAQYITQINYNDGLHHLDFKWEERPNEWTGKQDVIFSYFAGGFLTIDKRLKRIETYSGSIPLRSIHLDYEQGATGHSRIKKLTECAGIDDDCLKPIAFTWQNGSDRMVSKALTMKNYTYDKDKPPLVGDFNGDGFQDIATGIFDNWHIAYGKNDNNFTPWQDTGIKSTFLKSARVIDYNQDNMDDLMVVYTGNTNAKWQYLKGAPLKTALTEIAATNAPITGFTLNPQVMDINGDGRKDLMYVKNNRWFYRILWKDGFGAEQATGIVAPETETKASYTMQLDFNGDGLMDLITWTVRDSNNKNFNLLYSTGSGFESQQVLPHVSNIGSRNGLHALDINGDGLTDLLQYDDSDEKVTIMMNKHGRYAHDGYLRQAGGTGIARIPVDDWIGATVTVDYDNDGREDILIGDQLITMLKDRVVLKDADPHIAATLVSDKAHHLAMDVNGDGIGDIVSLVNTGSGNKIIYHNSKKPDYITTIKHGFDLETTVTYSELPKADVSASGANASFYDSLGRASYPQTHINNTAYVVKSMGVTNATGKKSWTDYSYQGMRVHQAGFGSLGFKKVISTNRTTGMKHVREYAHDVANLVIGVELENKTIAKSGVEIRRTKNTWERIKSYPSASGIKAKVGRLQLNKTEIWNKDLTGDLLSREVANYTYDAYNNPKTIKTTVFDASGATAKTTNVTNTWANNVDNWVIGLLKQTDSQVKAGNSPAVKKRSAFSYNESTGRKLAERIIDPDTDAVFNYTDYGNFEDNIDRFGNVTSTRLRGDDFVDRKDKVVYDSVYGLQIVERSNTLGQKSTHLYYDHNAALVDGAYPGKLKQTTDVNGLSSFFEYDNYGRLKAVTKHYGTPLSIREAYPLRWCSSGEGCIAGAVYYATTMAQGGSPTVVEYDKLGNVRRKRTIAPNGRWIHIDSAYNSLGQKTSETEPYFKGDTSYKTEFEYDALGRNTAIVKPDGRRDTIEFAGIWKTYRTDVNNKNQERREQHNALGQLVQVFDNDNTPLFYHYRSDGKLQSVQDQFGDALITNSYNGLGLKSVTTDLDKGTWHYYYNGLGELIAQTNGRGITQCMAYDKGGKVILRVDDYRGALPQTIGKGSAASQNCRGNGDAKTTWTYNTSGKAINLPKVIEGPDTKETFTYDEYGRKKQYSTVIEGHTLTTTTVYDRYSRPEKIYYPSSTIGQDRVAVRNNYNKLGFLTATSNLDGSVLYSRIDAVDSRGNATEKSFGNGAETAYHYEAITGFIESINTTSLTTFIQGEQIQDVAYDFDSLGNLVERSNYEINKLETFDYDDLNRLEKVNSNVSGESVSITYNAAGNILTKSDVGTYRYNRACSGNQYSASKNKLGQITGQKSASYCYDKSGNMVSGDGRSFVYSHFDKPVSIRNGTTSTDMQYGSNRELVYQEETFADGSVKQVYRLPGLFERVVSADMTSERHYIGDVILVNSKAANNNPVTQYRFLHKDHLGSVTAVTDAYGNIIERFDYDAWGKRRSIANKNPRFEDPGFLFSGSYFTESGFTGHHELDAAGVIHMGGRIYDPELGRFLQADPFIQSPGNLQSYNRYSYVFNNPLSYTDPTGYYGVNDFRDDLKGIEDGVRDFGRFIDRGVQQFGRALNRNPTLQFVVAVGASMACGNPACGIAVTVGTTAVQMYAVGASEGEILKGAVIAGVTSYVTTGIIGDTAPLNITSGQAAKVMLVSGISAKAQGGKFIDGVKGAGIGLSISAAVQWGVEFLELEPSDAAKGRQTGGRELTAEEALKALEYAKNKLGFAPEGLIEGRNGVIDYSPKDIVEIIDALNTLVAAHGDGYTLYTDPYMGHERTMLMRVMMGKGDRYTLSWFRHEAAEAALLRSSKGYIGTAYLAQQNWAHKSVVAMQGKSSVDLYHPSVVRAYNDMFGPLYPRR